MHDKIKQDFLLLMNNVIRLASDVRSMALDLNLVNSQEFINFEDELNKLSVADPNNTSEVK